MFHTGKAADKTKNQICAMLGLSFLPNDVHADFRFFIFIYLFAFMIFYYLGPKRENGSIRDELAPTTVRRYIIIKLRIPVSKRIDIDLLKKEIEKSFTLRIFLFEPITWDEYKEVRLGIFSPNASKHTAEKKLFSVLEPINPDHPFKVATSYLLLLS
jgi:hypothetical protein